jgi:hypothetical protein
MTQDPSIPQDAVPFYAKAAEELATEIIQACDNFDADFFYRLWRAVHLAKKGEKVSQALDNNATGAALMAFRELIGELQRLPSSDQVRERLELWRKEGGLRPLETKRFPVGGEFLERSAGSGTNGDSRIVKKHPACT